MVYVMIVDQIMIIGKYIIMKAAFRIAPKYMVNMMKKKKLVFLVKIK